MEELIGVRNLIDLRDLLQRLYDGSEIIVHANEQGTSFKSKKGINQGYLINFIPIIIVFKLVMKKLKERWKEQKFGYQIDRSVEDEIMRNLKYADDIFII